MGPVVICACDPGSAPTTRSDPDSELEPNEVGAFAASGNPITSEEGRHHVRVGGANSEENKPLRLHAILLLRGAISLTMTGFSRVPSCA